MATWDEVRSEVRGAFVLDADEPHEFALTVPGPGVRHQRVMVRHYTALEEEWVELRSAFVESDKVEPGAALDENLTLPVGAIARHGRFLVLVQRVGLSTTTVAGVISALVRVARVADWLEARHGGDRF